MSLQRRIVLPPLALGVHPAPPPKKTDKTEDKKKAEDKDKAEAQDKDEADRHKNNVKDKVGKPEPDGGNIKGVNDQPKGDARGDPGPRGQAGGRFPVGDPAAAPESPGSMVPEPGTPASNAPQTPAADNTAKHGYEVPVVLGPQLSGKTAGKEGNDGKGEVDLEEPLPPIRLVGPPPPRPVRTSLDLNPALPYPPINTDPRGAYYKYAKYNQGQMLYLDVTKDGWLSEQWRERSEREALAMLRGESEIAAMREAERVRALNQVRRVPSKAEDILLQLWNDLVQAPNHECTTEDFWSRYDWSDPAAQPHLLPARKAAQKEETIEKEGKEKGSDSDQPGQAAEDKQAGGSQPDERAKTPDGLDDVEWTKEGLEEILGTAGVMCMYNTPKPLSRSFYEPSGGYLILGHGFFMLRTEDYLQWKSEEAANKFEMLVTSGHDRVFGEMVKAQQAEERKKRDKEYKERKLAEKRAAEKEAKEKKERGEGDKMNGVKEGAKQEKPTDAASESPRSDVKVRDGELVKPAQPQAAAAKGDKVVVAVPVKGEGHNRNADAEKHEVEAIAATPGDATKPEAAEKAKAQVAEEKDGAKAGPAHNAGKAPKAVEQKAKPDAKAKKALDAVREAQMLAKMVAEGQTPPGIGMEDINLAFKALEVAAGADEKVAAEAKKAQVPLIWTWHDPCERWRWRNYEAGLHEVGPGGWEERDWRVFADDRGCDDYEVEESWAEEDERDVHDWSL